MHLLVHLWQEAECIGNRSCNDDDDDEEEEEEGHCQPAAGAGKLESQG